MNSTKKVTQKTSGTHKKYKPGQFDFCMELPLGFSLKPISKHKG